MFVRHPISARFHPSVQVTVLSAAVQAAEIEIIDLLLDYDADVPEGTAILIDESFDEARAIAHFPSLRSRRICSHTLSAVRPCAPAA